MPATAGASEPASTYNADGQIHADRCMEPKTTDIRLRYLDASPTGFAIPNPLSFNGGSCPDGQRRIDLHEGSTRRRGRWSSRRAIVRQRTGTALAGRRGRFH